MRTADPDEKTCVSDSDTVARADVEIALPEAEVWARLSDLSLAHHYVPGLLRTEITTPRATGMGASRTVHRSERSAMDETVVEWEDGRGFLLRLHRGAGGPPPPFHRAWFRYRIERGDERRTTVSLALGYEMRWGALGRALDALGVRRLVRRQIREIAGRLARYYETGVASPRR